MRLHTQLQFADIAKRWWRELANTPREIELQDIRAELFRASLDGEFDNADLQYIRGPRDKKTGDKWERIPAHPVSVTGAWLVTILAVGISLRSRGIRNFDRISVAIWDEISVGRDGFGRWCDDHGHPRPAFWFGNLPGPSRDGQSAGGQSRGKPVISLLKTLTFIRDDLNGDITEGALIHWFREKGITSENRYTFRKDFEDAYINDERHLLSWFDAETSKRYDRSLNTVRSRYSEVNKSKIAVLAAP